MRASITARDLVTPADPPRWLVAIVAVLLLGIAAWALPTSVQAGDAGELSTVMLRGGVPHPSGYPWMRALGLVARPLEAIGVPPATAAALPCALAAVVGWLLVLVACARHHGPAPAAFGVLLSATSAPIVLHTVDAEVWGPLVAFAGLVLVLATSPAPRPFVLGLALGLSVSHHLTAVLLVPLVVGAAWPGPHEREHYARALARRAGLGLAGSALGLSVYLTLAIGADGAWRWGDVRSLQGLVHHVTRADYGTLSLSLHTESIPVYAQWARALASVGAALLGGLHDSTLVGALVIVALVGAYLRAPSRLAAPAHIGLLLSGLASLLGLPAAFNLDPASPFAAWILERFDVLTIVLLTPAIAAAASLAIARPTGARARVLVAVLGVALLVHGLVHTARRGVPSEHGFVQRYAIDLLRTPPEGGPAIVIGTDDHRTFPVLYAQEVLGEGAHVIYVDASLLAHAWYRARLRERAPWLPDVEQPLRMIGAMWNDPAHRDTPVYLANLFSRPSTRLPRVPEGILWRVIAPHEAPPGPELVHERHVAAQARYGAPPPEPSATADPWTRDLWAAYHEGDARLAEAFARSQRAP